MKKRNDYECTSFPCCSNQVIMRPRVIRFNHSSSSALISADVLNRSPIKRPDDRPSCFIAFTNELTTVIERLRSQSLHFTPISSFVSSSSIKKSSSYFSPSCEIRVTFFMSLNFARDFFRKFIRKLQTISFNGISSTDVFNPYPLPHWIIIK